MNKKGTVESVGTLVLLIVGILIIINFGPKIIDYGKSFFGISQAEASENKVNKEIPKISSSNAEIIFDKFVNSYESCKNSGVEYCVCDQFDVTQIPDGYYIKLSSLGGMDTSIELYGSKPTPEKRKVVPKDDLCFYQYDSSANTFSPLKAYDIRLDSSNYNYKIDNKVQLFKVNSKITCFVTNVDKSNLFNEIKQAELRCNLKTNGAVTKRVGIIDFSNDDETSRIIDYLSTFLSNNVGRVKRITAPVISIQDNPIISIQDNLQIRQDIFKEAYDKFDRNNDKYISDDIYFISILASSVQKGEPKMRKDYFKVHYLAGSGQSKILAEKIISRLKELNGKLIYNDKELKNVVLEEYKFDFDVVPEVNTKSDQGPVFLACAESYTNFIACNENVLIPAVFIDIVEVEGDGHNLLEGHQASIARQIGEGIKDYLSIAK